MTDSEKKKGKVNKEKWTNTENFKREERIMNKIVISIWYYWMVHNWL